MRKYSVKKCIRKQLGQGLTRSARWLALAAAASGLLLSGCAATPSALANPEDVPGVPAYWSAPLPDTQRHTVDIVNWWRAQSQPELADLIEAAQRVSPTLAAARSRIAQARVNWRAWSWPCPAASASA
ncbi:UNVERIFIED_ORG: outer membrane protein TolC [Comamonas terrigena]